MHLLNWCALEASILYTVCGPLPPPPLAVRSRSHKIKVTIDKVTQTVKVTNESITKYFDVTDGKVRNNVMVTKIKLCNIIRYKFSE